MDMDSIENKGIKTHAHVLFQAETAAALDKVPRGTVSYRAARLGVYEAEPLLIAMDAMIAYAKAYQARFEQPVFEDGVLGDHYAAIISGLRQLLNGDGAVAMRRGITTDSKDNGCIEQMFWDACRLAGIDGNNL